MADADRIAGLVWTEEVDHTYQDDFRSMAKTLGITVARLKKILNGAEELDLSDLSPEAMARLRDLSSVEREDLSVEEFIEI